MATATPRNDTDELDLCIYYFETLLNVFKWCSSDVWNNMATNLVGEEDQLEHRLLLRCKVCILSGMFNANTFCRWF